MQVDFAPFLHRLRRVREQGAKQARRGRRSLPVPPRAVRYVPPAGLPENPAASQYPSGT
jgi:hypothetical protein